MDAFVGFMYFDGNQCEWVWFSVFWERVKGVGAENLKLGERVFGGFTCLVSWDLLIWRHPVAGGRCLRFIFAGGLWFHISVVAPLDFFVLGDCWIEG